MCLVFARAARQDTGQGILQEMSRGPSRKTEKVSTVLCLASTIIVKTSVKNKCNVLFYTTADGGEICKDKTLSLASALAFFMFFSAVCGMMLYCKANAPASGSSSGNYPVLLVCKANTSSLAYL